MTWNYRVVRYDDKDGERRFAIREAYYGGPGDIPDMITAEDMPPGGEDVQELEADLRRMLDALQKPVIDAATRREIRGGNQ